jgi:thiamine-monophosphate kinase
VNLSDLAAKGATPLAYMLGAAFGPDLDEEWLAEFARGLREDQDRFGVALLGGDTISVAAGPVISVTAFGTVAKGAMVHRFGGSAGDALYVSGRIGAAAAGLAILTSAGGPWDALGQGDRDSLVRRFRVPEPRTGLAAAVAEFASAAMDVSDGLVGDCDKLAAASGCAAMIEADRVPLAHGLAAGDDPGLLARLLTGGDDYEILAAIPPSNEAGFAEASRSAGIEVTRIGALREGSGPTAVSFQGRFLPLARRSYVHGRGEGT